VSGVYKNKKNMSVSEEKFKLSQIANDMLRKDIKKLRKRIQTLEQGQLNNKELRKEIHCKNTEIEQLRKFEKKCALLKTKIGEYREENAILKQDVQYLKHETHSAMAQCIILYEKLKLERGDTIVFEIKEKHI
jgi:predicted RNase H-like nuclease (RuvC/YqgF family)